MAAPRGRLRRTACVSASSPGEQTYKHCKVEPPCHIRKEVMSVIHAWFACDAVNWGGGRFGIKAGVFGAASCRVR